MTLPVLFLIVAHEQGMAYLGSQAQLIFNPNQDASIAVVSETTNNALGILLTVQGQLATSSVPERPGQPLYKYGPEFERVLSRHYQFKRIKPSVLRARTAMISFPGYPHPLQAMMRSELGRSFPISASLEEPLEDRPINGIGIWNAGSDFYSAMEAEAVATVFRVRENRRLPSR